MTTRLSLKKERNKATGEGFHLFREYNWPDSVTLELEGVPFESSAWIDPATGKTETSISIRIPDSWARKLGLIGDEPDAHQLEAKKVMVVRHARKTFGDRAEEWMEKPLPTFNGKSPREMLAEPDGARLVDSLLILIEEGIYI
jgi:hypothetical protein